MTAPTAASAEPTKKVTEMVLLTLMPMRRAVSKSLEAARMAMPVLVLLIRYSSATSSTSMMMGA